MSDCLFCRIAQGEIEADVVFEDEHLLAFNDKFPKASTHVLVIPKVHLENLNALSDLDSALMGHLVTTLPQIAKTVGLDDGYRTIVNTGPGGGQEIYHLHFHLLGDANGRLPGF